MTNMRSQAALLSQAEKLAGCTLYTLSQRIGLPLPQHLNQMKGWIGQALEIELGADAGNTAQPDFTHLQIELKSIPVDTQGLPIESTFISYAGEHADRWETSSVAHKLACILWVPYEGEKDIPLPEKRIGLPFLWRPNKTQWHIFQQDWQMLTTALLSGHQHTLTGKMGEYLQLRPKAPNTRAEHLKMTLDCWGNPRQVVPQGFYLRRTVTTQIFRETYAL